MKHTNLAILINPEKKYKVYYLSNTQSRSRKREHGVFWLLGGDLTKNQIEQIYKRGDI